MPSQPKLSWSVFVFGYNEETTIRSVLEHTLAVLREVAVDYEIVVIDDGSRDGTAAAAQKIADQFPNVRLVRHPVNLGIGRTLRDGYAQATPQVAPVTMRVIMMRTL